MTQNTQWQVGNYLLVYILPIGDAVYNFTRVHVVRTLIVCSRHLQNIVRFCQHLAKLLPLRNSVQGGPKSKTLPNYQKMC